MFCLVPRINVEILFLTLLFSQQAFISIEIEILLLAFPCNILSAKTCSHLLVEVPRHSEYQNYQLVNILDKDYVDSFK